MVEQDGGDAGGQSGVVGGVTFGDIGAAGVGTGGASTKVAAAKLAAAAGIPVLLAETGSVADALAGADLGTWFAAVSA